MTRRLPEPVPEIRRIESPKDSGRRRAYAALDDLLAWGEANHHTGVAIVRVNMNQGGVTSAKMCIEEPLPPKT